MRGDVEKAIGYLRTGTPEGREKALELLQDTAFSFCMKVCGNPTNAEDCSQEVMLQVMKGVEKFNSARALRVYLFKVAKTRCLMSRRRSKFAPRVHLSLEELEPGRRDLERMACCGGDNPERSLLASESLRQVHVALFRLPPTSRAILALHDMEGLPAGEIAEIVGLRPGTVRVRLHRARSFIRRQLGVRATPPDRSRPVAEYVRAMKARAASVRRAAGSSTGLPGRE